MTPRIVYPYGPAPDGVPVLWRCEAARYSYVIDADADRYGVTAPQLEMRWHRIDRRTPKGAWASGRFVLLTATKRWACLTEEEALDSFIARKQKHIRILTKQLKRAEEDLALAYPRSAVLRVA
ncbi:hypothetical protein [Bradyrhizobium sp. SZCCHNRI2010]|uniref:hypothetical protein n=1 Tax=Bradyrhizobium sp. SZCCHNRI2010 TaxID=3057283 RepID=UPI0028EB1BB2|nr:hypothetical protein [Bradyrhizobium sp. SZCCHNRI2010]